MFGPEPFGLNVWVPILYRNALLSVPLWVPAMRKPPFYVFELLLLLAFALTHNSPLSEQIAPWGSKHGANYDGREGAREAWSGG